MSEECKHANAWQVSLVTTPMDVGSSESYWCPECGGLEVNGVWQLPNRLRPTKYVIRSHDSQWWLTKGGLQEYAPPPRAMVFDTQLEAEQNLADYRRDSPGAIAIHVETITV